MCAVWEQKFALVLPAAGLELRGPCSASELGTSCFSEVLLFPSMLPRKWSTYSQGSAIKEYINKLEVVILYSKVKQLSDLWGRFHVIAAHSSLLSIYKADHIRWQQFLWYSPFIYSWPGDCFRTHLGIQYDLLMGDPNADYQLREELFQLTPAGYVNVWCHVQMIAAVLVCVHVCVGLSLQSLAV